MILLVVFVIYGVTLLLHLYLSLAASSLSGNQVWYAYLVFPIRRARKTIIPTTGVAILEHLGCFVAPVIFAVNLLLLVTVVPFLVRSRWRIDRYVYCAGFEFESNLAQEGNVQFLVAIHDLLEERCESVRLAVRHVTLELEELGKSLGAECEAEPGKYEPIKKRVQFFQRISELRSKEQTMKNDLDTLSWLLETQEKTLSIIHERIDAVISLH